MKQVITFGRNIIVPDRITPTKETFTTLFSNQLVYVEMPAEENGKVMVIVESTDDVRDIRARIPNATFLLVSVESYVSFQKAEYELD